VKRQYLGDSKDSFKWDYHDLLVTELACDRLVVALMLTPDDGGRHGKTDAELFPAQASILQFCAMLRRRRDVEGIRELPRYTGGSYEVALHRATEPADDRDHYFAGFDAANGQVVFVDPDNGFEPERSCGAEHVSYRDIRRVVDQIGEQSVVTVFQHFRRVPFSDDLARIRARLETLPATGIAWHSLMFVAVGQSKAVVERIAEANRRYAILRRLVRPIY
jgi:hypothetical protein